MVRLLLPSAYTLPDFPSKLISTTDTHPVFIFGYLDGKRNHGKGVTEKGTLMKIFVSISQGLLSPQIKSTRI